MRQSVDETWLQINGMNLPDIDVQYIKTKAKTEGKIVHRVLREIILEGLRSMRSTGYTQATPASPTERPTPNSRPLRHLLKWTARFNAGEPYVAGYDDTGEWQATLVFNNNKWCIEGLQFETDMDPDGFIHLIDAMNCVDNAYAELTKSAAVGKRALHEIHGLVEQGVLKVHHRES